MLSTFFDQRGRVVFAPSRTIVSKISGKSLFAPWTTHRRTYRSKSRDSLVGLRILERNGQVAMPAHGMTENTGTRRVDRKTRGDDLPQLPDDVRVHPVA